MIRLLFIILLIICALPIVRLEFAEVPTMHHTPPIPASDYQYPYKTNTQDLTHRLLTHQGESRHYYLYTPSHYLKETARPLIILLHGSGRHAGSLVERWKSLADQENLIVAGPAAWKNGRWNYESDGGNFLRKVIEDVANQYEIDRSRIYLFGHSAGGNFTTLLAARDSSPFAAMSLHAATFPTKQWRAYLVALFASRPVPLSFIIGTDDPLFPLSHTKASATAFHAAGFDVNLHILEGHNHWYYTLSPFINELAWDAMRHYKLVEPVSP